MEAGDGGGEIGKRAKKVTVDGPPWRVGSDADCLNGPFG
jgi:hypothetical protein